MSVQAALDAGWEVDARDVISQILRQHGFNEGDFASGVQAMLYSNCQLRIRQGFQQHTHLAIASMVHEDNNALSSTMLGISRWRREAFESKLIWPPTRNGTICKEQTLFVPEDEKESRKISSTADVKRCRLHGTSRCVPGADNRAVTSSVNCSKLANVQTIVQLCSDLAFPSRGLIIGFPGRVESFW